MCTKNSFNQTLAVDSPSQTLMLRGHPKFANKEANPLKNGPNPFKINQEIEPRNYVAKIFYSDLFLKFC